jgi:hypothetical protein
MSAQPIATTQITSTANGALLGRKTPPRPNRRLPYMMAAMIAKVRVTLTAGVIRGEGGVG